MLRTRTLLITTAIAFAVPLAAGAQSVSTSGTKCGPVSWSTDKMSYSAAPCSTESVGTGGPTANQAASAGSQSQSSSMTKAEMKRGMQPINGYAQPMPMQQAQAVSMGPSMGSSMAASPNMAPMGDQCGPSNAAAIKDEYGRKYNCRGDRIR